MSILRPAKLDEGVNQVSQFFIRLIRTELLRPMKQIDETIAAQ